MSAPARYIRRRAPVDAMRVCTDDDLADAQEWLRAHGVIAWNTGHTLHLLGPGSPAPLRLGQWLVREVVLNRFDVLSDFEFSIDHREEIW